MRGNNLNFMQQHRIDLLNRIGFCWANNHPPSDSKGESQEYKVKERNKRNWMNMYTLLLAHSKVNGFNFSRKNAVDERKMRKLSLWTCYQRRLYRKQLSNPDISYISKERIDLLNEINFPWRLPVGDWQASFNESKGKEVVNHDEVLVQRDQIVHVNKLSKLPASTTKSTFRSDKSQVKEVANKVDASVQDGQIVFTDELLRLPRNTTKGINRSDVTFERPSNVETLQPNNHVVSNSLSAPVKTRKGEKCSLTKVKVTNREFTMKVVSARISIGGKDIVHYF
mmetsp:Transcript_11515/g.15009  ORF Transcript_11515/g.15009 Transcript_11515/m.15009 type:complete len:282 (-) Transcript_11515:127-972(-)